MESSNPLEGTVIHEGLISLMTVYLQKLSDYLSVEKKCNVSVDELKQVWKMPVAGRNGVISPIHGTGPIVTHPIGSKRGGKRGTGDKCPFLLTKGKRVDKPCERPANRKGLNGRIHYCATHYDKFDRGNPPDKNNTNNNSKTHMSRPSVKNPLTESVPVTQNIREEGPPQISGAPWGNIDGYYKIDNTKLIVKTNRDGSGYVVGIDGGKDENDICVLNSITEADKQQALSMGLGVDGSNVISATTSSTSTIPSIPSLTN